MRLQQADNNKQQQQQQQNKETDKQNWKRRLRDKADYGEYLWLWHCVRVFWWRFCCQSCMHKIFMRREICNTQKMFSPRATLACNFSHSNEITNNRKKSSKKKQQKLYARQSLLLKCSAFNFYFSASTLHLSFTSSSCFFIALRTLSSILPCSIAAPARSGWETFH